uniref:Uncharacterized protein n=1 Tax=Ditylenchus dipsaci TaxID=166011 RepID=A0A915ESR7_9BILA
MQIAVDDVVEAYSTNEKAIVKHKFHQVEKHLDDRDAFSRSIDFDIYERESELHPDGPTQTKINPVDEIENFNPLDPSKRSIYNLLDKLDTNNARETAVVINKILAILSNKFVRLYDEIQEKQILQQQPVPETLKSKS